MNERNRNRYRKVMTCIHEDPWFAALSPGARNLFLNLIPSVGTSGVHSASICRLAKLAGYENSIIPMWMACILVKRHLKEMSDKVVYWPAEEIIWLKSFHKLQGNGPKFLAGAIKHANNFPAAIQSVVIPYISQPHALSDGVSNGIANTHAQPYAHTTDEQSNRVSSLSLLTSEVNEREREAV